MMDNGDENHDVQDSSDSSDVCSDDLFSSGSDLFGEEDEDEEQEEQNSSPSDEPLPDMSTLLQELPFKKGLSKHYNGKSQSFSSLSNVRSLEDLAKPENPFNKKLKACRSYGGLFLEGCKRSHISSSSSSSKLGILKKSSGRNGGFGSRKNGSFFIGNGPSPHHPPTPPPPHRSASSTNFANQTPLLA